MRLCARLTDWCETEKACQHGKDTTQACTMQCDEESTTCDSQSRNKVTAVMNLQLSLRQAGLWPSLVVRLDERSSQGSVGNMHTMTQQSVLKEVREALQAVGWPCNARERSHMHRRRCVT